MSFAIVHMQKMKMGDVKGIEIHNERKRESKTNKDIDKEKTHLNYDLHNSEKIYYTKKIKDIIENEVESNKAIRKDAVVMTSFVITSDKLFFDNLTEDKQKEFFEKSYEFFKTRYGEQKMIAAKVHLDEKTPHMHLSLVPVTKDKKLSAKLLFDRKELLNLQDQFPKYMQSNGFNLQRGSIDSEAKHIETQKLKKETLEKEIDILEGEIETIKSKKLETEYKQYMNPETIKVLNDISRKNNISIDHILEKHEELKSNIQTLKNRIIDINNDSNRLVKAEDLLITYEKSKAELDFYQKNNPVRKLTDFHKKNEHKISKIKEEHSHIVGWLKSSGVRDKQDLEKQKLNNQKELIELPDLEIKIRELENSFKITDIISNDIKNAIKKHNENVSLKDQIKELKKIEKAFNYLKDSVKEVLSEIQKPDILKMIVERFNKKQSQQQAQQQSQNSKRWENER